VSPGADYVGEPVPNQVRLRTTETVTRTSVSVLRLLVFGATATVTFWGRRFPESPHGIPVTDGWSGFCRARS